MYSHEIQNILEAHTYTIKSNIYKEILDTSQQINYIKYNPYDGNTYLSTSDGYSCTFTVVR